MHKRIKHKNLAGGAVANHRQANGCETIASRSLMLNCQRSVERDNSPGRELAAGLEAGA
jgi:hypothetical protein